MVACWIAFIFLSATAFIDLIYLGGVETWKSIAIVISAIGAAVFAFWRL
jgi:hypothetical protein